MKKINKDIKQELIDLIGQGSLNGLLNTDIPVTEDGQVAEDRPTYLQSKTEQVYKKANSYIILGRDRMGNISHGFGGRGVPNSNAIDIVVGLSSSKINPLKPEEYLTPIDTVNKDYLHDAARIYISQRTNLDESFDETLGKNYNDNKRGVSGIAMKADTILIQGRRNIKIKAFPSKNSEKDAHGNDVPVDKRIELITGDELEPIVKGKKLVVLLEKMFRQQSVNRAAISTIIKDLNQLRAILMFHTHAAPPTIALPSPELLTAAACDMPQDIVNIIEQLTNETKAAREIFNSLRASTEDNILSKSVFSS